MRQIKSLTGKTKPWYVQTNINNSDNTKVYDEDRLTVLKGIGPATEKKFEEEQVIIKISDLKTFIHLKIDELLTKREKGVSLNSLVSAIEIAKTSMEEKSPGPIVIDHRNFPNPYKSLYGDSWNKKILECT